MTRGKLTWPALLLLALALVLLPACQPQPVQPPDATPTPQVTPDLTSAVTPEVTPTPETTPTPDGTLTATPEVTPTPDGTPAATPEVPQAVEEALFGLATQHRLPVDDIELIEWEQVDWPDGCLGVPIRGACTQVITPGYRLIVEIEGEEYEYRTNLAEDQPLILLLAEGPEHDIDEPALVWEGEVAGVCQSLLLADDGRAAFGPCDAPHTPMTLHEELGRVEELSRFRERFASFQADTVNGMVVFEGEGDETASLAWERAVAAWAGLVRLELEAGRSGASWGLALAWNEELEGDPERCRFLQVQVYGYAYASTAQCEGGDPEDVGRGRLTDDEWETFDELYYAREPLDEDRLVFTGRGDEALSDDEIATLNDWAAGIYDRLGEEGTGNGQ